MRATGTGSSPLLHEYRVVALDLRGHGRSGWASEGAYGIEDYAGDLARAVDSVLGGGARRLALVGHSMGALASMVYASRHSDRLWATVFMDIDPRPPDRQHERLHAAGQRPARVFASLGEVEAGIDRLTPGLPGAVVAMLAAQGFTQTEGGYTQRMDQRTLAEFPQVDNRPLLPSISVPAMVVRGDKSMVSSLDGATEAAASLPQGRLVLVDGEHQVHIQHPEALAAVLTPFLGASAH